jgi:hypothetical protein
LAALISGSSSWSIGFRMRSEKDYLNSPKQLTDIAQEHQRRLKLFRNRKSRHDGLPSNSSIFQVVGAASQVETTQYTSHLQEIRPSRQDMSVVAVNQDGAEWNRSGQRHMSIMLKQRFGNVLAKTLNHIRIVARLKGTLFGDQALLEERHDAKLVFVEDGSLAFEPEVLKRD